MRIKQKQLSVAVLRTIGMSVAVGLAVPAFAQTAAKPAEAPQKAEKIEVTGSRIQSANLESISPVTVVDAEAIKADGQRSVENILNALPQVFATQGANVSNGATGTATVSLRGLGSNRTLVLVNGRRLPYGSANSSAADLNQIPAGLIKRVEILTGGAGAVYGSDAVAGVVNFIMNDKFEGVQLDLNQSFFQHEQQNAAGVADIVRARAATNPREFAVPGDKSSDGKVYDASLLMGANFAGNKGNATVYFGYKKEDALLQSERDFSACSLASSAAGFSCGGSGTNATGRITNLTRGGIFTNGDSSGTARAFANATDQYNFGPANFFQRPSERYNAAMYANYDVFEFMKLYSEFSFNDYRSVAQIAPGGAFGTVTTVTGDNPLLSASWRTALFGTATPAATATADIVVQRRNVEGGGRQSEFRNTSFRTVIGAKGDIGNWSYDAFMQTSKVAYQQNERNYFSSARLARALDVVNVGGVATCRSAQNGTDTACVPYNVFRLGAVTADQLNYLQTPGFRTGSTQQTVQGITFSSDLSAYGMKLPAAKNGVAVAIGVERRSEKLDLSTDGATQSGDLSGSGGPTPPLTGKFTVQDIFTEVRMPLVEGAPMAELLNLTASYRTSDYSTNNKTNTYGVGLEYAPNKMVKARASYQEAVRGANVIELFTQQGLGLWDGEDPCAGANPTASLAACQRTGVTAAQYRNIQSSPAGQYNNLGGGNPNLRPEKSKSNTLGLIFTPTNNLSASLDFFDIKVEDAISTVSASTTLNLCLNQGQFCNLIQRDRLGTLWLLPQGFVSQTNQNLGSIRTSGVDINFNYNLKLTQGWGGLGFNVQATKVDKYEVEEFKGRGTYDCVGLYGNKCGTPTPELRHKSRVTWNTPWNVDLALTWRYFDQVKLETTSSNPLFVGASTNNPVEQVLGKRDYFDIAAAWAVTKNITLRGGMNNLFDKDPPITSISGPSIFGNGNTFAQVYDTLGRKVFLNLTAKF